MSVIFLIIAFTVNALASVLLKINTAKGVGFNNLISIETITGNFYLWGALFLFTLNIVFYYLALRAISLSIAYPVMVVGTFFIISISSILLLKESLNPVQIIGYSLVIVGITLISYYAK